MTVLDTLAEEIIAAHNDLYHPGWNWAENEHAGCVDRFGGTPAPGLLGERRPLDHRR